MSKIYLLPVRLRRHFTEKEIGVQAEKMEMSVLCGKEREEDEEDSDLCGLCRLFSVGCEQTAIPEGSSDMEIAGSSQ
jgi:hypothetical protein